MISLEEALRLVDDSLAGSAMAGDTIPLRQALGRTLLADQFARLDLPPFDKSAVDGYAIGPDKESDEYELLETVAAGRVGTASLRPGTTVKVMTGAPVPKGTERVAMVEHAREEGSRVRIIHSSKKPNICREGEDVRVGDCIAPAGTVLGAPGIACLISAGITEVEVARPFRAAVISTGDEIADDPADLRPGRIMNSNGPMLAGLLTEHGMMPVSETSVGDDLSATTDAIRAGLEDADCVILSGGVSVGDYDFVPHAMERAGLQIHFRSVAIKPGKPTVFATAPEARGRFALGLPGNPVAVLLGFHLFLRRARSLLCGRRTELRSFRVLLGGKFKRRSAERCQFVPARLAADGTAQAVAYHGSAHLLAASRADGFFRVPVGTTVLDNGEEVEFFPILGRLDKPVISTRS
ncbi:MAG: molybdopterin molybdotransferase MoeA [Phycisphaerales bacterium]|nr:MAG: molybdopterin molybdotransferase MoeA [Phycisphaerales bacterium]